MNIHTKNILMSNLLSPVIIFILLVIISIVVAILSVFFGSNLNETVMDQMGSDTSSISMGLMIFIFALFVYDIIEIFRDSNKPLSFTLKDYWKYHVSIAMRWQLIVIITVLFVYTDVIRNASDIGMFTHIMVIFSVLFVPSIIYRNMYMYIFPNVTILEVTKQQVTLDDEDREWLKRSLGK